MSGPGREPWRALAVFGLLAFFQGVIEPTEGLPAQPVRSSLMAMGRGPGEIARFAAILGLPWAVKPWLGLLSDAIPARRGRRRVVIAASGAVAALAFVSLAVVPTSPRGLLIGLFVASLAVTAADVATDALVVERGRADGRTGRYQAAQWFCLYASGIATGAAGGLFSQGARTRDALATCALVALAMISLAATSPRGSISPPIALSTTLWSAARSPRVLVVAGFLALSNFNPFLSSAVLQVHLTEELGLGERAFGVTMSILAASSMAGALIYGIVGPRVPLRTLAHASVWFGAIGNLVYLGAAGPRSVAGVTVVVGLASITATLVQVELAAEACPPGAAASVFAGFMAICNLSAALATWLGGEWYERLGATWGRPAAFRSLVLASAIVLLLGTGIVRFLPGERAATRD